MRACKKFDVSQALQTCTVSALKRRLPLAVGLAGTFGTDAHSRQISGRRPPGRWPRSCAAGQYPQGAMVRPPIWVPPGPPDTRLKSSHAVRLLALESHNFEQCTPTGEHLTRTMTAETCQAAPTDHCGCTLRIQLCSPPPAQGTMAVSPSPPSAGASRRRSRRPPTVTPSIILQAPCAQPGCPLTVWRASLA